MKEILADVEFNKFNWSIFIRSSFISTNTNFKIIGCGLGQLLAEPGDGYPRWVAQFTAGRRSTALTIPEWVT